MAAELLFGSTVLAGTAPDGLAYSLSVQAEGTDWGDAEAVVVSVRSALQDGELASVVRFENRTAVVFVRVEADSYDGLAEGEEVLAAEVSKGGNTLTWTPPLDGVPTVFDVVWSDMSLEFDDLDELRLRRTFRLELACLPNPRSDALHSVLAEPSIEAPDTLVIDDATLTANWSSTTGSVGTSGGEVFADGVSVSLGPRRVLLNLIEPSPIELTDRPYLVIDYRLRVSPTSVLWYFLLPSAAPAPVSPVASVSIPGGTRVYLASDSLTEVDGFRVIVDSPFLPSPDPDIYVANVFTTDSLPSFGTTKQRSFAVQWPGSARSEVTLALTDEGTEEIMGDTLIYTGRAGGFSPPLRTWRTSGNTPTPDADTRSGSRNTLDSPTEYQMPAESVPPGTYAAVALVRRNTGSGAVQMLVRGSLRYMDGSIVTGTSQTGGTVITPVTTDWQLLTIAQLELPSTRTSGPGDYLQQIDIESTSGDEIDLDEVYLFNVTTGRLSWVDASSAGVDEGSGESAAIVLAAPTLDEPLPLVWLGEASGAPGVAAGLRAAGGFVRGFSRHELPPGSNEVFVSSGSPNVAVRAEGFPRWRAHARALS